MWLKIETIIWLKKVKQQQQQKNPTISLMESTRKYKLVYSFGG